MVVRNSVAAETFGPSDKYVAANDNVPQDESGQSAGFFAGLTAEQKTIALTYRGEESHGDPDFARASIRGPLGSGKPYLYTAKELANLEPEPLPTLDDLAKLPGFIYLGSPYAKYHAGMDEAARVVTECAGKLMARGMRIYCPITHGHAVTRYEELPRTWSYWKYQDQPLIDAASSLIVLEMHGWWHSVGLEYEFDAFMKSGKPIVYLEPSELGVEEPKIGRAQS